MTLKGGRELQLRLRAIGDNRGLSRRLAVETVAEGKRLVRRKTGLTGRTIRIKSVTEDGATVTAAGAGPWLEFGTRPHIIRPVRARMLAWGGRRTQAGRLRKGAKAEFFARFVRHPGTRPYPFLIPAAKAAVGKLSIQAIIDRWNGAA